MPQMMIGVLCRCTRTGAIYFLDVSTALCCHLANHCAAHELEFRVIFVWYWLRPMSAMYQESGCHQSHSRAFKSGPQLCT
jgi:hypothetical protein